jgi:hypothetical protein
MDALKPGTDSRSSEEGARFPMMMVSSGVWAGSIPLETAWTLKEISNEEGGEKRNMKQELERIGFLGDTECSYKSIPLAAHFELHIGEKEPGLRQASVVVDSGQSRDPSLRRRLERWELLTVSKRSNGSRSKSMGEELTPVSWSCDWSCDTGRKLTACQAQRPWMHVRMLSFA